MRRAEAVACSGGAAAARVAVDVGELDVAVDHASLVAMRHGGGVLHEDGERHLSRVGLGVGLGLELVCSSLCTQAKMPQVTFNRPCNGPCPLCNDTCDSYGYLWVKYEDTGWTLHSIIYYHGTCKACVHHYVD